VVWTHRTNLARIRAGTEPRLGAPGSTRLDTVARPTESR
jgi:hypothetical protein